MNFSLLKILYIKEIRSGRIMDYGMILMISSLILYSKVHIITPFLVLLLSDRFVYPLWHRNEEYLFYYLVGFNNLKQVLIIRKLVLLIECNVLFIMLGLIIRGLDIGIDIINFNCYLFLFLLLSDYLFNISIHPNHSYNKWGIISIILLIGILFSLVLFFSDFYLNSSIVSTTILMLFILLNFLSGKHLVKVTGSQKYFIS